MEPAESLMKNLHPSEDGEALGRGTFVRYPGRILGQTEGSAQHASRYRTTDKQKDGVLQTARSVMNRSAAF